MENGQIRDLLAEVKRDIADASLRLDQLRGLEEYLSGKLGPDEAETALAAPIKNLDFAFCTQKEAAHALLDHMGRPMTTIELAEKMVECGYPHPNSRTLRTSLYAVMVKNPNVFIRIAPGTWDLVDR